MAKKELLRRGFKAEAERIAIKYREELGIHACAPLCAFDLAKYLKISIHPITDFNIGEELPETITGNNPEWSALTFATERGNQIIIHNSFHSIARQQSNIMHEIAHILCKHKRSQEKYDFDIPWGMHEYDETQEEEAKCLGATLQLAKPGLLWARNRRMTIEEIATYFNASTEMVQYRRNMIGIYN